MSENTSPTPPTPPPHENGQAYAYNYGAPPVYPYHPYGGYYGNYYGGDNEDNDGSKKSARSFGDYVLMVRERFWYIVLAVFVCTASSLIYTASKTPEWTAMAKLRIFRHPYAAPGAAATSQEIDPVMSSEDFQTQIEMMKSLEIVKRVSSELSQTEINDVLAPYKDGNILTGPLRPEDVMVGRRDIIPQKQTLIAYVSFTHTSGKIATQMADRFADGIRSFNEDIRKKIVSPMLEVTALHIKLKDKEISDKHTEKQQMIQANNKLLTLDLQTIRGELSSLGQMLVQDQKRYEEAGELWNRLNELKQAGKPLTDLAAVAHSPRVSELLSKIAQIRISIESLRKKYEDVYQPLAVELAAFAQTEIELKVAVAEAATKIHEDYQLAKKSFNLSSERVKQKESDYVALSEYQGKLDDVNQRIVELSRMKSTMEAAYVMEMIRTSDGLVPNIFILERAMLTSLRPINQNFLLAGGMGLAGGLVLGLAIVFGLAFLDDRVKSSTDIEGFLGLPLIGVMPTTHRFDSFKKARLVASGEDRSVTEAFRSLYSALKINELSNTAKVFITTSTTPSEGKSFITTNLAMTYAALGEKVLILDGDLRMPAVGKTLKLEGDKGITRFLRGTVSLDDAIFHGVEPNLDVLPVGAPCKNPTQVLNSKPFADLISNLKERYDRIFIDSPPVGAVSDCLNLLPQVDGIIFIVRFNSVKRRFVKSNIRRLQEAKVPIFGAILNQIGVRVARYYTNTGDSSYSKYYSRVERDAEEIPVKP